MLMCHCASLAYWELCVQWNYLGVICYVGLIVCFLSGCR